MESGQMAVVSCYNTRRYCDGGIPFFAEGEEICVGHVAGQSSYIFGFDSADGETSLASCRSYWWFGESAFCYEDCALAEVCYERGPGCENYVGIGVEAF